jgi:hypothetical protein
VVIVPVVDGEDGGHGIHVIVRRHSNRQLEYKKMECPQQVTQVKMFSKFAITVIAGLVGLSSLQVVQSVHWCRCCLDSPYQTFLSLHG